MTTNGSDISIQITANVKKATESIDKLIGKIGELNKALDGLDVSKASALSQSIQGIADATKSLNSKSVSKLGKLSDALSDVANSSSNVDTATDSIEGLKNAVEDVEPALKSIEGGVKANSFDGIANDVKKASERFKELSPKLEEVSNKMKGFKGKLTNLKILINTKSMDETQKKIARVKEQYEKLYQTISKKKSNKEGYVDSAENEKDVAKLEGLRNEYNKLIQKQEELSRRGGFKFNTKGFEKFSKSLSSIKNKIDGVLKKIGSLAKKLFHLDSATKSAKKSTNSFSLANKDLSKQLLRTAKMLRLMLVRMALRKVIDEVGNGFKSLALHSEEFNSAVSGLLNGSKQLGYSFSAMVSPLIEALAPALEYVIGLLTKLLNIINQVFSAIAGKTTWNKAKGFSDDFGQSVENANKSAKELKKTVLGFDELNQLTDKTTSGGDTSGNITDMYETEEIEGKWSDLADKIKDIFDKIMNPIKKAWEEMGDGVVLAWKRAFENVGQLLKDIGRDFLEVWNQNETLQMLKNVLGIIQDIGSVVGYLAKNLDEAWNKNKVGKRILEDIRDIFAIIIQHIKNATSYTVVWAKNLDFTPILEAFEGWLSSLEPVVDNIAGVFEDFYVEVLLPLSKWTLEEGLPELLQVFEDFNNKVDWEGLRENLKEFWKHLEPFAETVGEGLIIFIKDVSDALADFLNSEGFENFLKNVEEWMDNVSPEDVADSLKKVAGAIVVLKGALFALSGLKTINDVFKNITTFLNFFKDSSWLKTFQSTVETFGKFGGVLFTVGASIQFIDNFKFWSNQSEIEDFNEQLKNGEITLDEYKEKVKGNVDTTYNWKDALKDFFTLDGVDTSSLANNLAVFEETREKINTVDLKGWFESKVKPYLSKDKWSQELSNVKNAFSEKWTEISNWWKSSALVVWFNNDVKPWFTKTKWTNELNNIKTAFSEKWNEISNWWKNSTLVTWFNNDVKPWFTKDKWATEIAHIKEAFKEKWDEVEQWWNTSVAGTWFNEKVKPLFDKDKWTFDGIKEGLKSAFEGAIEGVKEVWNKFANYLNEKLKFTIEPVVVLGKTVFEGCEINLGKIPTFSTGGFPEDGLFMANSNELVGQFSNGRTAVANNEQIISGIKQGVYEAVAMAMSNSNSGSGQYINNTIQIDGEAIARAVTKGQNSLSRRYNPVTV